MGLLSPYIYVNKKGKKFWLHARQKGKVTLYFFSRDPRDALLNIPKGFEAFENPKTGMPMLRKKIGGGLLSGIFKRGKPKEELKEGEDKKTEEKKEEPKPAEEKPAEEKKEKTKEEKKEEVKAEVKETKEQPKEESEEEKK